MFLIPEDWYFWTHRLSLARAMRDAGFDVVIATRLNTHGAKILAEGFRVAPIRLSRRSRNPLVEFSAILDLVRLYRRERPALVHQVTVKPVLYGSMAATIARVPGVVNAVAGLGHAFVAKGLVARLFRWMIGKLYTLALSRPASRVIFQTEADRDELVLRGVVRPDRTVLIRGAGVDINAFQPTPEPGGVPIVMFAGRVLWTKGVGDLVEAGRLLAREGMACRIVIVGTPDADNPMSIPEETLRQWQRDGSAEWWGKREDMPSVLRAATIVTLPTFYGEGVPKVLLEAAACGRAIIASDLPGCRDAVRDEETGIIVPARQPEVLACAIRRLLTNRSLRDRFGKAGRALAVMQFSESAVVRETLAVYRVVLQESVRGRDVRQLDEHGVS